MMLCENMRKNGKQSLMNSNFKESVFDHINFKNANLMNADFRGSVLVNVNLRKANLENADFRGAIFINTKIGIRGRLSTFYFFIKDAITKKN